MENTNIMSDILFNLSDYVITICVIISRAIIVTPSVRRTRPPDGPELRPTFTFRQTYVRHTPDIQRTNAGHIYEHRTQPHIVRRTVRRTVPSCEDHITPLAVLRLTI